MSTRQPLILVPGLVCDGAVWAHQRAGLADVADCIVPDVSRPDTMQAMAAEVLAAAPEKFAIAGLSLVGDCGHMPLLERLQAATALMRDWMIYG